VYLNTKGVRAITLTEIHSLQCDVVNDQGAIQVNGMNAASGIGRYAMCRAAVWQLTTSSTPSPSTDSYPSGPSVVEGKWFILHRGGGWSGGFNAPPPPPINHTSTCSHRACGMMIYITILPTNQIWTRSHPVKCLRPWRSGWTTRENT